MSAQFMKSQESCHSEKKAYVTPDVTVHGKVETITATSDEDTMQVQDFGGSLEVFTPVMVVNE